MTVSVVVPVYNGGQTINKTLKSLLSQKDFFDELIVVDDASSDDSLAMIKKFDVKIIRHKKNKGLAASYNSGIRRARGDIVVFAHQDISLYDNAFKELLKPFSDKDVVCSYHYTYQSFEVWDKYKFWEKYFFCRWVNKKIYGVNGKFDAFTKSVLTAIGLFDEKGFKSAGEDGDIMIRLRGRGKIVKSEAGILHLHQFEKTFSLKDIVRKQAQLSEAQGALYRKHGMFNGPSGALRAFFREILLIGTLAPVISILSWIVIAFYCFFVSRVMFYREYKDYRTYLLPVVNFVLFVTSFIFSVRGFLYKKQSL